ncbi:F-box protein [Prunus yedoensis var. nudiflora]|uniref:F-box protein n=1 Tax=Prunus yedoensis var. nudiflora TaxID=2094558 RepID=A0A314XV22_PRUYE|nr:F-box protein [Prunus yedoensis var. nudiflora]
MKEHGVKESWSLELRIVDLFLVRFPNHEFKFGEGQILSGNYVGKLGTCAPGMGFVQVEFDGRLVRACVNIPSVFSPKRIIRG